MLLLLNTEGTWNSEIMLIRLYRKKSKPLKNCLPFVCMSDWVVLISADIPSMTWKLCMLFKLSMFSK